MWGLNFELRIKHQFIHVSPEVIYKWPCHFVISDSPGYKPDQSCAGLKEEPGTVCVQSEGHVDTSQLSGGILDGKPKESQPAGRALLDLRCASLLRLNHCT